MSKNVELKYINAYILVQNNTGGSFIETKQFKEGSYYPSAQKGGFMEMVKGKRYYTDYAILNEEDLPSDVYFNGVENGIDCECCGDRWHECNFRCKDEVLFIFDTVKDFEEAYEILPEYANYIVLEDFKGALE